MADIKSSAAIKYSSSKVPEHYSELATNTNINRAPAGWLLGRFAKKQPWKPGRSPHQKQFGSFAMANNFVDVVGKVDVITDAENIKTLLKMTHSGAPVNMILHRVGRTLLIDNLDVYKNILSSKEHELKWLWKFMSDTLSSETSASLIPMAPLSRQDLEAHIMLSKFLYHSVDSSLNNDVDSSEESEGEKNVYTTVPDPLVSDSDLSSNNNFERNVLWNFEDIRMLIGTDLPIFGAGTHPCVTLRLKDMKKPISVLTGIDYWLDQLMCTVPEVVMCYHLNGIVQRYEIIKTEDLPNLPESTFSAELIRDVAQNILSFLKSNATKEGHTYWLFRDKDDDIVKLYDLTSVCKEYMDENDANPFTLPVAVLMYRVARNLLQYSSKSRKNVANTVYRLLIHCLDLLDAKKYPQVVGSAHYFLANLYMTCINGKSSGSNDVGIKKQPDLLSGNQNDAKSDVSSSNLDDDSLDDSFDYNDWYAEDTLNRLVPQQQKLNQSLSDDGFSCVSLECLTLPPNDKNDLKGNQEDTVERTSHWQNANRQLFIPSCSNVEDCWQSALEHILKGLNCVEAINETNYSQSHSPAEQESASIPGSHPIPLRHESLNKPANRSLVSKSSFLPLSVRCPDDMGWRFNLLSLLLVKAIKNYELLGNYAFTLQRYGKALRYVKLGFLCYESARKLITTAENNTADNAGGPTDNTDSLPIVHCKRLIEAALPTLFVLCGDIHCIMGQAKAADMDKHARDYGAVMYRDKKIADRATTLLGETQLEFSWCSEMSTSIDENLKLSQKCYERVLTILRSKSVDSAAVVEKCASERAKMSSMKSGSSLHHAEKGDILSHCDDELGFTIDAGLISTRLGNVKNNLGIYYMNLSSALLTKEKEQQSDTSNAENRTKTVEQCWHLSYAHFQEGIQIFNRISDKDNEALLNSNGGRLMRLCASTYCRPLEPINSDEEHYLNRAIEMYQRALECVNPGSQNRTWETIAWELSTVYFTYGVQLQDRPILNSSLDWEEVQKRIVDLMQKSLRILETLEDVDNIKHNTYLYRISIIHHKLGSLYHKAYRNKEIGDKKAKQLRSVTELHYKKAAEGFKETVIDTPVEFIRIQIERAVLFEGDIEGLTGTASKLKTYCQALDAIIQCRAAFMSICRKISSESSRACPTQSPITKDCVEEHDNASDDTETNHCNKKVPATKKQEQSSKNDVNYAEEFEMCKLALHRLRSIIKACLLTIRTANFKDGLIELWKGYYKVALTGEPNDILLVPSYTLRVLESIVKLRESRELR